MISERQAANDADIERDRQTRRHGLTHGLRGDDGRRNNDLKDGVIAHDGTSGGIADGDGIDADIGPESWRYSWSGRTLAEAERCRHHELVPFSCH